LPTDFGKATNSSAKVRVVENQELLKYTFYEKDPAFTTLNQSLYYFLKGIQVVLNDHPEQVQLLFDKIKPKYQNGLFLESYIEDSERKEWFNKALSEAHPQGHKVDDYVPYLTNLMVNGGFDYTPTVNLYNAEFAELKDNEYYLALQVEDMEEIGQMQDLEYVPALHVTESGGQLEMIDHYHSYFQSIPVFLFAFELKKDIKLENYSLLAPIPNTTDPQTYHLYTKEVAYNQPPKPGEGRGPGPNTPPSPPPPPAVGQNKMVHESVELFSHFEKYYDSEYYISYAIESIVDGTIAYTEFSKLAQVGRNYVDCGCYWTLGNADFVGSVNNTIAYSFVTYEHDWWASTKNIGFGNFTLPYKATLADETYIMRHNAGFPSVNGANTYTESGARHILRRL
jgi:hypothetical protein